MMAVVGVASLLWNMQAAQQQRAVSAAASYSSIINELNLLSVNRHSGWTHRGLQLIQDASSISTPLRDSRQLRDWSALLLTNSDIDMTVQKRFTGNVSPTDMAYAPSGRRLAVGLATDDTHQELTVLLIDLESEELRWLKPETSHVATEQGSDPGVTSLRFGQDDDTLYVGTRNGLLLRLGLDQSPPTVKCTRASLGGVLVRLSADGRYCVTATSRQQKQSGERDERVRCFDAKTLEQIGVSEANQRVGSLSIAPDSSRMAISWDDADPDPPLSMEYSLPRLEPLGTIPGKDAQYHPRGRVVFTAGKTNYERFNLEKPYDAAVYLPGLSYALNWSRVPTFQKFQLADNGALLALAMADKCICFWRESESLPWMQFRLSGNRNIFGYAISPTMDSIAVMTDDALEVYNYNDRRQYHRVISLQSRVTHFSIAPDQGEFATYGDNRFCRYRMPSDRPFVSEYADVSGLFRNAIAYDSLNQNLVSMRAAPNHTLEIVISSKASAPLEKVLTVVSEPEERFAAHKLVGFGWIDEDHLVAAVDFRLLVWNVKSGQLETVMPQHNPNRLLPSYRAIAVQRDHCVTITAQGTLDHWRWTGKELAKVQPSIELNSSEAERLAWHPNGEWVIVGTQSGSIRSINLKLRRSLFVDEAVHTGQICGAAWCDAERLVTASRDGKLALWQQQNGILKPYVAWDSRSGINELDVSSDGKLCFVASTGESISVFDLSALDAAFAQLGIVDSPILQARTRR